MGISKFLRSSDSQWILFNLVLAKYIWTLIHFFWGPSKPYPKEQVVQETHWENNLNLTQDAVGWIGSHLSHKQWWKTSFQNTAKSVHHRGLSLKVSLYSLNKAIVKVWFLDFESVSYIRCCYLPAGRRHGWLCAPPTSEANLGTSVINVQAQSNNK
jgi:hypothetical protein